jgi:hypothetical protein
MEKPNIRNLRITSDIIILIGITLAAANLSLHWNNVLYFLMWWAIPLLIAIIFIIINLKEDFRAIDYTFSTVRFIFMIYGVILGWVFIDIGIHLKYTTLLIGGICVVSSFIVHSILIVPFSVWSTISRRLIAFTKNIGKKNTNLEVNPKDPSAFNLTQIPIPRMIHPQPTSTDRPQPFESKDVQIALHKLIALAKVTSRIKIADALKVLNITYEQLLNLMLENAEMLTGCRIDDEFLMVNEQSLNSFMQTLDNQFQSWQNNEKS